MTETLLVLLDATETADRDRRKNYKNDIGKFAKSKSLIIGHSFGARVVEHAVSQAFIAKRLESKRIFEDPDLGIAPIKNKLRDAKTNIEALDSNIDQIKKTLEKKTESVKQIKGKMRKSESEIEKIKLQLMSLPTSDEELNAYREFEIDTMKSGSSNACKTYKPPDVVNCATREDSVPDFRQLAICAVRQVQCVYESYICSIKAALKKGGTDTSSSSRSCERRMIDLDTGNLGNEDGASKDNDIKLWHEFLDDLKEKYRMKPPLEKVTNMSNFEFAKKMLPSADDPEEARPFYQTHFLLEKLGNWNIVPNTHFAPRRWLNDPTDGVENKLIDALKEAEQHVKDLVNKGTEGFKSINKKLSDIQKNMATKQMGREKLQQERGQMDEQRKKLEREIEKHKADIKKMQTAFKKMKNEQDLLTEDIRYELDTFLRPPANLVLLLNPATEAMSAQNLINAMCTIKGIGKNYAPKDSPSQPWVVSITSESDYATKLAFPFGVWVGRVFGLDAYREYGKRGSPNYQSNHCDHIFGKHKDLLHRTAGHLREFHSHSIIEKKDVEPNEDKFVLRKEKGRKNNEPYWIMKAPPEVIDGHDDIFNERVQSIFFSLLKNSEVLSPTCPRYDPQEGPEGRCVKR